MAENKYSFMPDYEVEVVVEGIIKKRVGFRYIIQISLTVVVVLLGYSVAMIKCLRKGRRGSFCHKNCKLNPSAPTVQKRRVYIMNFIL